MDISHLFEQIKTTDHDSAFGCTFIDMQFQSECRRGYKLVFILFKCKMCGKSSSITKEKDVPENNYLPINKAVVSGSLSVGM